MMERPDEKFGAALELAFDAAAILVRPVENGRRWGAVE
jgi:hypothetical protein